MDHSFQPPKIAVVGSANADLIMTCPTLPGRGQTLAATEARWEAGGKGANQAVAAARLGASVAFIGCIGADALGERVRAGLAAEGIAIAGVRVAPEQPTGVAVVVVDAAGENLIVLAAGANAALGAPDVERAAAQLRHADIVLCQLETPPGVVDALLDVRTAEGPRLWLNPAPAQPLPESWLARLDLLVPNQSELETLTGIDAGTRGGAIRAAADLRRRGVGCLVVTLGAEGALIADADGVRFRPALRVDALDTTGAGDCFIGALACAQASGRSFDAAVDFAQCAAALQVTRSGAQAALPTAAEVAAFAAARRGGC
ncbi:MAG: ribokinase [Burkholderiales bacterium]|nr:ribokinase [Burkholderiales bacterium]